MATVWTWLKENWKWVIFPVGLLLLVLKLGILIANRAGDKPIDLSGSFDRWTKEKQDIDRTVGDRLADAEKKAKDSLLAAEKKAADEKKSHDTTDGLRDSLGDKFGRNR